MQIVFINSKDNKFTLGSVSFDFLNKNGIFDPYQEDDDCLSKCIFKTSEENVENLVNDIIVFINGELEVREDIRLKLEKFADFVRTSGGIINTIVE